MKKEIIMMIVVFSLECLDTYWAFCTRTGGSLPLFDQTFVTKNKVRKTRIALAPAVTLGEKLELYLIDTYFEVIFLSSRT